MSPTSPTPASPSDRLALLNTWLASLPAQHELQLASLAPASADASFRRYFRITTGNPLQRTLVVMDAPPPQEDCHPFVKIAGLMHQAGLHVPRILEQDLNQGFLLLTDLGSHTYLNVMSPDKPREAHALFVDAIDALIKWQLASKPGVLPEYNEALLQRELDLFPAWYVQKHLKHVLTTDQQRTLDTMFKLILSSNLAQPKVYVHRDYMPRNLMISTPNPGVLDFQDAVYGPITYDVASLFKDAFISWEEEEVLDWTIRYWERAKKAGLPVSDDFAEFYRDCEWMGLQRHLKVLGIFARINYRDGKPHYLSDTPRFVAYVRHVSNRYIALKPLLRLFDELEGIAVKSGYTF